MYCDFIYGTHKLVGTQYSRGYYFYEACADDGKSARDTAQNMVGWAEGLVPVSATKDVSITLAEVGGVKGVETVNVATAPNATFTFQLINGNNVIDEVDVDVDGANVDDAVEFFFDPIVYAETGEYTYTISEVKGNESNWTYDDDIVDVIVNVTKKNGKLVASVSYENDDNTFTNTYTKVETPSNAEAVIKGSKVVDGDGAPDTEFTFVLVESGSKAAIQSVKKGEGDFSFKKLTYDKEGKYHYSVKERQDGTGDWIYDKNIFNVLVTVTKLGNKLEADVDYTDGDIEFVNVYTPSNAGETPESTEIRIIVTKEIKGDDAPNEEFTFVLSEGDKEIERHTQVGGGSFLFDWIEYDEEGTHTYTVKEVKGDAENWTYDETEHKVKVVVKEKDGVLDANVTYVNSKTNSVVFTNTYEKPTDPTEPETTVPETTEPETTVPETTAPETTTPETTTPETTTPDSSDDKPERETTTAPETTPETAPVTDPTMPTDVLADEVVKSEDNGAGVLGEQYDMPFGVLPATGDASMLWILVALVSSLGLVGLNDISKKRKNK